jgi:hypothetical protein
VGDVLVDEADAGHRHRISVGYRKHEEPRLIKAADVHFSDMPGQPDECPLLGPKRTSRRKAAISVFDLGCVKTQTLNLRVEFSSRFRRCGNQSHWWVLLAEGN